MRNSNHKITGLEIFKVLYFAIERLGFKTVLSNNPYRIKSNEQVVSQEWEEKASSGKCSWKVDTDWTLIPTLKPVLGICLGMQLMYSTSEEGDTKGLILILM
jgi:glutamine amidotransferase